MRKFILSLWCISALLFSCAGTDGVDDYTDESSDQVESEPEIGQVKQPVGIKVSSGFSYGVTISTTHTQSRCQSGGGQTCSVPQTKGPTYFVSSSLNATEKFYVYQAVAYLDNKTNWVFTETTDQNNATLIFNRLDICTGLDIQGLVCVNLSAQGNTLTEPTSIPNTFTEHSKGIIHVDRAKVNASTTNQAERERRIYHGLIAAIASWMGHGTKSTTAGTPIRLHILNPDVITDLSAGEICAMNGFLPKAQFGAAGTIGIIATCASD